MPLGILTLCGAQGAHKAGPTGQAGRAGGHQVPEVRHEAEHLADLLKDRGEASGASSRARILMRNMTFRLSLVGRRSEK